MTSKSRDASAQQVLTSARYILAKVLRATSPPRSFILSGDNLQFFPLGTIARRAGAFIRPSARDDEIYGQG
jgi:glycerol-3-phosphate O-acyltransferase